MPLRAQDLSVVSFRTHLVHRFVVENRCSSVVGSLNRVVWERWARAVMRCFVVVLWRDAVSVWSLRF